MSLAVEAVRSHGAAQKPDELADLVALLDRPRRLLEIGTHTGGTLWLWSQIADDEALILSVDDRSYGQLRRPALRPRQTLAYLEADSHDPKTRSWVEQTLGYRHQLDFLFIDGDHSYDGVKADFEDYSPLVRPGGIVALHDVVNHPAQTGCEVHELWLELREDDRYPVRELIRPPDTWGGIGVVVMP